MSKKVSEKTPLIDSASDHESHVSGNELSYEPNPLPDFDSDQPIPGYLFNQIVDEVRFAISRGVQPSRISQGSSGSYFCRDRNGKIVGVFKPKNEEPYGQLNPKWTKWLHRTCCPCCFGRGCLIPNSGYISEASASVVDQKLGLNIVPRTQIISLASKSFYYPHHQRRKKDLPLKIGSFQTFVRGYKDAIICIKEFQDNPMSENLQKQFRFKFERLVILDYIIRNTDRGNDNWLIKVHNKDSKNDENEEGWQEVERPEILIAAIDNGLAFPFKHPDDWRTYPFGWSYLPAAQVPFSEETSNLFLPKLVDPDWCDSLVSELRDVAKIDSDYNEKLFNRQMAVLRGQIYNLVEVLMRKKSPIELVRMPPVTISHLETDMGFRRRLMSFRIRSPTFECC